MAMAMTMIILFMVMAVMVIGMISNSSRGNSSGIMYETANAANMANTKTNTVAAFNLAESGMYYTLWWLTNEPAASLPQTPKAFAPSLPGATTVNGRSQVTVTNGSFSGTFSVLIYPNPSNPTSPLIQHYFMIESVGVSGAAQQVVQVYVTQNDFANYGYFTNTTPSNIWWNGGLTVLDGPAYCNNADGVLTNVLWYNTPGKLWLTSNGSYSCAGASINWGENSTGNMVSPKTNSDWADVAANGASAVHTGQPAILLPTGSSNQAAAALGTATAPTSTSVIVPNTAGGTSGGIYIQGAVSNMTLSVNNNTTQVITIQQSNGTSTITINPTKDTTTLAFAPTSGSPTNITYSGVTNGMVYCEGSIGSSGSKGQGLSGTIADGVNLTISTDSASSSNGNIYLDGSLMYNTPRPISNGNFVNESSAAAANFDNQAGMLGLIANTITLDEYGPTGSKITSGELDAITLAANTFSAQAWDDTSVKGTWFQNGGYVAGVRGDWGQFDSGTGSQLSGYWRDTSFDSRLKTQVPPFFPLAGNKYEILSWNVTGAPMS